VYVADRSNQRIQKFDSNGTFITKWGSFGSADGEFFTPSDVETDSDDNVYVADAANHRMQKFDSNGTFITKWGSLGFADGQFSTPIGIGIDVVGNVYVAEQINNRIQKSDTNGTFITKWGSSGTADGEFNTPRDVTVDSAGNVYVADQINRRIQVFEPIAAFFELNSTVILDNSSPIANDDSVTTFLDTSIIIDALANDTDADSDPLNVTSVTTPSNGTAALTALGDLLQNFTNPTPAINDNFGFSASIDEDRVIIGARLDDTNGGNAGAAYLFDATTGVLLQNFFSPKPSLVSGFGLMIVWIKFPLVALNK